MFDEIIQGLPEEFEIKTPLLYTFGRLLKHGYYPFSKERGLKKLRQINLNIGE